MRRRRLLLAVGAAVLLGVEVFPLFVWLTSPTTGVTWDNFRRLRLGISAADVEALLGESFRVSEDAECSFRLWRGDGVEIILFFEAGALVRGAASPLTLVGPHRDSLVQLIRRGIVGISGPEDDDGIEYVRPPQSPFNRIRRWLPW